MDEVKILRNQHHPTRPSLEDVLVSLTRLITKLKKAFIVIDALDECRLPGNVEKLLDKIFELQAGTSLNIFATSRDMPNVEAKFDEKNAVCMEIKALDEDMMIYLNDNLSNLPIFVRKIINSKTKSSPPL